jgi:glycolate oxidase FAD binding subunit
VPAWTHRSIRIEPSPRSHSENQSLEFSGLRLKGKQKGFPLKDLKKIVEELAAIVGSDSVMTARDVLLQYRVDELTPRLVVLPRDTNQVAHVVQVAKRENLALVPWGNGTKMAMGNPPKRLDLVVCTSRMNHIKDVDTANLTITVEAGVKFRDIQARLATQEDRCYLPLEDLVTEGDEAICSDRSHSGCFLPIDPPHAHAATIGGIVAANTAGARRLLYRLPRDSVLGVRFVTPGGEICGSGGKTVKNVSGYDISKLAVGSMGSLGILCEMTFKLLPLPEKMETLLIAFRTFSDAAVFVEQISETTLLPASLDLLNQRAYGHVADGELDFDPEAYVAAVALEGFEQAVRRMNAEIVTLATASGARSHAALREEQHRSFWFAVSDRLAALDAGLLKAKLNYPLSEWKGIVESAERLLSDAHIDYTLQVHAGSGVCLINLLIGQGEDGATERAEDALNSLLTLCREVRGNLVIQQAPTATKGRLEVWGAAGSDFAVMKRIKTQIDPAGIMSPGRFVGGL